MEGKPQKPIFMQPLPQYGQAPEPISQMTLYDLDTQNACQQMVAHGLNEYCSCCWKSVDWYGNKMTSP
jgi:hypothetical protein